MMKEFKNASLLLMSAALIGCGLAEPNIPEVVEEDETAPKITQVNTPLNLGSDPLPQDANEIRFQLTEAIDETTIENLSTIEIKSHSNIPLKGTWSYQADLENDDHELVFTIDRTDDKGVSQEIEHSQEFRLTLGIAGAPTVKDLAGNELKYELVFSTPSYFDIEVIVTGLNTDQEVIIEKIERDEQGKRIPGESVTIDTNTKVYPINSNLEKNNDFLLEITQQPTDSSYCTFDNSKGKVLTRNEEVLVTCTEVGPYNIDRPAWNDYYRDGNGKFTHAGEQRALTITETGSCTDVSATDALNLFDWACEEITIDTTAAIRVYSSSLKPGEGLSNLIAFGTTPSWQPNSVNVKYPGGEKQTIPATWWNNPVFIAPADESLNVFGAVYAVIKASDDDTSNQNYIINNHQISLVVSPLTTLVSHTTDSAAVLINDFASSWIEGKFDANQSKYGIHITTSSIYEWHTTLRNVQVSTALEDGVVVSQLASVTIENLVSSSNGGQGLYIDSSPTEKPNVLKNIVAVNNTAAGVHIASSNNKLNHVISINNQSDGLVISKPQNTFNELYLNNNIGNGLLIDGAQNNTITSLTSASNNGNGVQITKTVSATPLKNLVVNGSIVNNKGSAIKFDMQLSQDEIDGTDGSIFNNLLDAFNATSICGANPCSGLTTVSSSGADITALFSHPTSDAGYAELSETNSKVDFSVVKEIYDFNSVFRTWSNTEPLSADSGSGSCSQDGIDCQLLDLRLNGGDIFALDKLPAPSTMLNYTYRGLQVETIGSGGNDDGVCDSGETCEAQTISYLENATEISNDGIGNDDGLCEANEACVSSKNIGSYQGQSNLTIIANTTAATNNITLFDYSEISQP